MATSASHNLPVQLTSFVGRRLEMEQIVARLGQARLVTLVGVGGGGKTRLAIETASTVVDRYTDGVSLVDLAPQLEPSLVANSVAAVLGVPEPVGRPLVDALATHLRDAELLLVLDNCEHLTGAVAELVARLLAACADLRVLATSRERLGITGEALWSVPGLHCPPEEVVDAASIREFDAVRLFCDRAFAVEPTFSLSEGNAAPVANICRCLDGVPLAIELAAARVNTIGVDEISERMVDRFQLLRVGSRAALPRHRTLRAVVEWSYDFLDEEQRRTFDRLSVFVGSFTRDAAEAVCGEHRDGCDSVAETLYGLVDRSLVTAFTGTEGDQRYRLLNTLRSFGQERLEERGEAEEIRRRHAAHIHRLAELAWSEFRGPAQARWANRLEYEHGNVRAALVWCITTSDFDIAVRVAGAVAPFWDLHGHYTEGRQWLERALAGEGGAADARVRALNGLGTLAMIQGDLAQAIESCEAAAALSRATDDQYGLAYALQYRGFAAMYTEELDDASELLEQSLVAARRADDRWLEGWSLLFLTAVELAREHYERAITLAEEAQPMLDAVGEPEGMAWAALMRGAAAYALADLPAATMLLGDSLRRFWELQATWGISMLLLLVGMLAGARDQCDRSVRLLGASERLRESIGAALLPFIRGWLVEARAHARTALGTASFDAGWSIGSAWTIAPAVAEAAAVLQTSIRGVPELEPSAERAVLGVATLDGAHVGSPREATLRRDGEYWTIAYEAPAFRIKDVVGMTYLAELLANPQREWHVFDLVGVRQSGDAGPVLDETAKGAYRQRMRDLAADLEEAERWADVQRAEQARAEIDVLTDQLAAAVGLGGRDRKAGSGVERVRVNVTKAIRSAIKRIAAHDAMLGQHLDRSVKTGTFCSYAPDAAVDIRWRL